LSPLAVRQNFRRQTGKYLMPILDALAFLLDLALLTILENGHVAILVAVGADTGNIASREGLGQRLDSNRIELETSDGILERVVAFDIDRLAQIGGDQGFTDVEESVAHLLNRADDEDSCDAILGVFTVL
jgi:hypothetical protein